MVVVGVVEEQEGGFMLWRASRAAHPQGQSTRASPYKAMELGVLWSVTI